MNSTILGGHGFIGSHIAKALHEKGQEYWLPKRGDPDIFKRSLGTVYYCIGLTSDFREHPYDTINAHICLLNEILEKADFKQLIYLSTTRVYAKMKVAEETQIIHVEPFISDELYNLSKLMGESLVLSSDRICRVARLSNVLGYKMGSESFIGMLIEEASRNKSLRFSNSLESEKDYIWIDDVVNALLLISEKGKEPIYNIASGKNLKNQVIADLFEKVGVDVSVAENSPNITYPPISIEKMVMDLEVKPKSIEFNLSKLINISILRNSRDKR